MFASTLGWGTTAARSTASPSLTTRLRAAEPPVDQAEGARRPRDGRARVLEPVEECQVGEEVLVLVDRPLDLLELREQSLGSLLPARHLLAQQRRVPLRAEEELQQQTVARDAANRLAALQPAAELLAAGAR